MCFLWTLCCDDVCVIAIFAESLPGHVLYLNVFQGHNFCPSIQINFQEKERCVNLTWDQKSLLAIWVIIAVVLNCLKRPCLLPFVLRVLHLGPVPASGYFWILSLLFPDTPSLHMHPANSEANPDSFATCGRGNFGIRKEKVAYSKISAYVWMGPLKV